MNINATLLVQMLTFALFVWFTMKLVWPHITKALDERQTKIAEGLAAAERGHRELELAQHKVTEQLRDVKAESVRIIEKANRQSNQIVEEAKGKAREEGQRLLEVAKADIDQEVNSAKRALRQQVAAIAVSGAEKILGREIDEAANAKLIDDLIKEL